MSCKFLVKSLSEEFVKKIYLDSNFNCLILNFHKICNNFFSKTLKTFKTILRENMLYVITYLKMRYIYQLDKEIFKKIPI